MTLPARTSFTEVRPAMTRPAVKAGGESDARYFSASSNAGITDLSLLALNENIASTGMALEGSQSIRISDSGVYVFTYSISFVGLVDGSSNVTGRLRVGIIEIPGGGAKGGTFFLAGTDNEFGTVANSVIYRLDGAASYLVDFEAFVEGSVISTHRTLTAHRIAV